MKRHRCVNRINEMTFGDVCGYFIRVTPARAIRGYT